jgi:tetratricopeptide (TPR) repeat protein
LLTLRAIVNAFDLRRVVSRKLAELTLRVAQRTPGSEERAYLEGCAYAVLGNGRRVAGQLPAAGEAFLTSRRLRAEGAAAAAPCDESHALDLEASLCRAQRRFPEALALHKQALAAAPPEARASILLNTSKVHEELCDHEAALSALREAASALCADCEPRFPLVLRFNIAGNLHHLNRDAEAEQMLPEIRALAEPLGNALDLVRLRWLEAWIGGGLGRSAEARTALEEVRQAFLDHQIEYDRALVSLELAVYLLEAGESARARDLAREALEIFERQQVPRETLAALTVFHQATEQERATAELARRLLRYLDRARSEPELRFEG